MEFDALVGLIDGKLSPEEQTSLEELHKYMLEDEGSWALGENFLNFISKTFRPTIYKRMQQRELFLQVGS